MSKAEKECSCFVTPEHTWFRYGDAIEPGSQFEPNPDCPVHFPPGGQDEVEIWTEEKKQ